MVEAYPLLVAERHRLADTLDTLTDEQWATPSLCAGWTVRDVVAHLVFPSTTSKLRVIVPFAKARFDFDRMTMQTALGDTRSGPELERGAPQDCDASLHAAWVRFRGAAHRHRGARP